LKTITLALQGGGAHGALTWGVLDRLLEEEEIVIVVNTRPESPLDSVVKYGALIPAEDRRCALSR